MSDQIALEEQVKEMAKKIADEVLKANEKKEENKESVVDASLKSTVEKMVKEQLQINEKLATEQRKSAFEEKIDVESEEDYMKKFKSMNEDEIYAYRDRKMISNKKTLSYFHGQDISERIENFKELNDDAHLISTMLYLADQKKGRSHKSFLNTYRETSIYKTLHETLSNDVELRKALAVGNAGQGAEWIPTGFSSKVLEKIELNLRVASLFESIQMPTNPYKFPVKTSNAEGYLISENTTDTPTKFQASTPGTDSPSFNAIKLAGRVLFSEEISEDSIINVKEFTSNELAKAISRAQEQALVNGDAGTQAAHMDNAAAIKRFSNSNNARLAFDGLRYFALNNAGSTTKDFANADPSDTLMGNIRQLAKKYGVMPSEGAWIFSVAAYLKALFTLNNIQTLEKYGPNATVLSGELFKYSGIPAIVSEYVEEDLNASGVYDGVTVDRTMILYVHRPSFMLGYRGGVSLDSALDIETDQIALVAKRRLDFIDQFNALTNGNPMCTAGINVKTV